METELNKEAATNLKLPVLETQRLTLRPLELTDAPSIFAYAQNPKVSLYTMWEPHKKISETEEFIKNYAMTNYAKSVPEPFGICLKSNPNEIIGTVGCFWVSKSNKHMEIGYAMNEDYWGQGIMVEAANKALDYIFANFDVERIQGRYKTNNVASERVMEKLGMIYEGCFRREVFHRQQFFDMKVYSIMRDEWRS